MESLLIKETISHESHASCCVPVGLRWRKCSTREQRLLVDDGSFVEAPTIGIFSTVLARGRQMHQSC